MIETPPDVPPDASGRKLSGATWAGLAFVGGTLFALLPMYYLYSGGAAAPRETAQLPAARAPVEAASEASGAPNRFASRMTYELSQMPEEPPARAVSATPAAMTATAEPAIVAFRREPETAMEERGGSRVANARPISATPPDPRDTTRGIENEARRGDYREPTRVLARAQADAVQPRIIEGRDVILPAKGAITTKPIGTTGATGAARPLEGGPEPISRIPAAAVIGTQERKAAEVGAGTGTIGAPPEASGQARGNGASPEASGEARGKGAAGADARTAGDVVESRLAATREWLNAAPQTTHTIQIMGTNSEEQLKNQLRALAKVLEPQKIYVFRTFAQGKPAMTVVYGGYADRQAALQALEKLPPSVSANRPVLRTVNGIRAELKQHGIKAES